MTSRFRLSVLLMAVVAMFAFASTAGAKGGGGGGGGTCATLDSFSNALGSSVDGPTVTTSYSVFNGCVDERMSSIAVDYRNDTTGFVGRQVIMASYGANDFSRTWPAGYSTRYTITVTVYSPNGKVQATASQRVTTPDA
jgi:hypothetical protein